MLQKWGEKQYKYFDNTFFLSSFSSYPDFFTNRFTVGRLNVMQLQSYAPLTWIAGALRFLFVPADETKIIRLPINPPLRNPRSVRKEMAARLSVLLLQLCAFNVPITLSFSGHYSSRITDTIYVYIYIMYIIYILLLLLLLLIPFLLCLIIAKKKEKWKGTFFINRIDVHIVLWQREHFRFPRVRYPYTTINHGNGRKL